MNITTRLSILTFILSLLSLSVFTWNIPKWIDDEYKNFRIYPRMDRVYNLIGDEHESHKAKVLLEKVLEIEPRYQKAIVMLVELCIQQKDEVCIKRHAANGIKDNNLDYIYRHKVHQVRKEKGYAKEIVLTKNARSHFLKKEGDRLVKRILFESYLINESYQAIDELIKQDGSLPAALLEPSKISGYLKNNSYAPSLVQNLPGSKEYISWRYHFSLQESQYAKALNTMH